MSKRRRIHAAFDEPASDCAPSLVLRLLARELGGAALPWTALPARQQPQRRQLVESCLTLLQLQAEIDSRDAGAVSAVIELVAHQQLLFVLAASGVCAVFTAPGFRRLGCLNSGPHELIRSLLRNTHDGSIVSVSCLATDQQQDSRLHCTRTPATPSSFGPGSAYCSAGVPVLEVVGGTGWVEFDEASRRALLFNGDTKQYKVFDLAANYSLLYCLGSDGINDIKLGGQHLLLVHQPSGPSVQLEVLSAANGQRLAVHTVPMAARPQSAAAQAFDVLELLDGMVLLKQPLQPLHIHDVVSWRLCGVSDDARLSQVSSFIHLEGQQGFMTVCGHDLGTWGFNAKLIAELDDSNLWFPAAQSPNTLFLTRDWVVAYCKPKARRTQLPAAGEAGSIHISCLASGRLVAAVGPAQAAACDTAGPSPGCLSAWVVQGEDSPRPCTALTELCALTYDEADHVLYSANQAGHVHVWAAGQLG